MNNLIPTNRTLIKFLCLAIGIALGTLLIPNLSIFDEDLQPEIRKLITTPSVDIFQADNAAIAIYGLASHSSLDAHKVGEQLLRKLQKKHLQQKPAALSDGELEQLLNGKDLDKEWQNSYPVTGKCNPRDQLHCFATGLTELKATPIINERLLAQLERYKNIRAQSRYIDDIHSLDFSSPLPNYSVALQLSRLATIDAYLHAGLDGLIAESTSDMQFWQMVLRDSQTLIGKMVAINALRGNLLALSYAISAAENLSDIQSALLDKQIKPLTSPDFNFAAAVTGEFLMMNNSTAQFREWMFSRDDMKQWLLYPLTQTNASINMGYARFYQPAIALSQVASSAFYQQVQLPPQPLEFSRLNPYNLGGKINLVPPLPYYSYIGRGHDLTGIYEMLRLQLDIKRTQPIDIAQFIKTSNAKNPYTQQVFDYDEQHRQLSFRCFDAKDICSIQL